MRIGVDGACWSNRRGFGRFTRCLVSEMVRVASGHELVLFVDPQTARAGALPARAEIVTVAVSTAASTAAAAGGSRSARDMLRTSVAMARAGCDVLFFPATYSYVPVVGTPLVVTVHDAIAERLPELTMPTRADRVRWTLKQRTALRQARAVLTVSDAARTELIEILGIAPARLRVIHEAPDERFRPLVSSRSAPLLARFAPGERFLIYVGGISPHKNLEVLITAFEQVARDRPDIRLLLVGDADDDPFLSDAGRLRRVIERSPAAERIQLTGFVTDDELVALYSAASASVLPSLGEGFGLTAAESAACGTPVVASRIPALEELLGDAGLYADPTDPAQFAAHLARLLDDRAWREARARQVAERASAWSWTAAAETTIGLLEQVGSGRD